jgi:hypothetical protein
MSSVIASLSASNQKYSCEGSTRVERCGAIARWCSGLNSIVGDGAGIVIASPKGNVLVS